MDEELSIENDELEKEKIVTEAYPIKDLIENCEALTSYKKEVAVGALFSCEKTEMSKEEFKGRIKNFLGKKVK